MSEPEQGPKTNPVSAELSQPTAGIPVTISGAYESRSAELADWPPLRFADNDHILTWWLPDYDEALRRLAERRGWIWIHDLGGLLRSLIPESVLNAWITSDPLCATYAWYNILQNFAIARAKQLGFAPRSPQRRRCSECAEEFSELSVPVEYVERMGLDRVDFCGRCLELALGRPRNDNKTPAQIAAVIQVLARELGREPTSAEVCGAVDFRPLGSEARRAVVRALALKPSAARLAAAFPSVEAALGYTGGEVGAALPPIDQRRRLPHSRPAPRVEQGEEEWPKYEALMGSLPTLSGPLRAPLSPYHEEVSVLMGMGSLALCEAALLELCERDTTFYADLARLYAQTARRTAAEDALNRFNHEVRRDTSSWFSSDSLPHPRDARTVTDRPIFFAPLESRPRGNVRFVLVGGRMDYLDRRGEHTCVSGEESGSKDSLAENVSRLSAMVESSFWIGRAVQLVQSILETVRRARAGEYQAHVVAYASDVRDAVKSASGSPPKTLHEEEWSLGPNGKSRWSRERAPWRYVFNANRGFSQFDVSTSPAAAIWAWADRSAPCLQAFLDTAAVSGDLATTVVLPDIPDFRRFARAYVRRRALDNVERAFLEAALASGDPVPNMRGVVIAAEFSPQLVIHPDGSEVDGSRLTSALAYLGARHTVRLSVWDVLNDPLLSESATRDPVTVVREELPVFRRNEMRNWYARYRSESPDWIDAIFRPFHPRILDAVQGGATRA